MPLAFNTTCGLQLSTIEGTDCIGDSRTIINSNIQNIGTGLCSLSSFTNTILPITNAKLAFDGGAFSFRNRLINAQGLINQRGYISGTATTVANQYTLDRWRVVVSGQTLGFSTTQNVTTFTAPANGVEQVIEGINIETGTYVLKWTGTATATVNGNPISNGGTISLTSGSNATVRFINGTFSLPQLERGTTPTPFEYRNRSVEIILCQRYYEKSYNIDVRPGDTSNAAFDGIVVFADLYGTFNPGNRGFGYVSFKVSKRVPPTVVFYSPYSSTPGLMRRWNVTDYAGGGEYTGTEGFEPGYQGGGSLAMGGLAWVFQFTADAEI